MNPERYRHCERGGPARDESRSLERSEKAVWVPKKRKSGDLLKRCLFANSASTELGDALRRKSAAATWKVLPWLFVFYVKKDYLHFSGRDVATCYDAKRR